MLRTGHICLHNHSTSASICPHKTAKESRNPILDNSNTTHFRSLLIAPRSGTDSTCHTMPKEWGWGHTVGSVQAVGSKVHGPLTTAENNPTRSIPLELNDSHISRVIEENEWLRPFMEEQSENECHGKLRKWADATSSLSQPTPAGKGDTKHVFSP